MARSLYQKYRPNTFAEVIGQTHIIRTLSNAVRHQRISHAYLLTGPRGTGKTTLARIFAKSVNCLDPKPVDQEPVALEPCTKCNNCRLIQSQRAMDLIEIDAASHTGVDNIRQLKETVVLPPTALKYKVYIIDEVHMLSMGAFNALLKTLEEPPSHAIFILATTELHKVPETIISRCQRFDFRRLTQDQIILRLRQIADQESVTIDDEALETIALEAEGGMRDAESLLGQILSLEDATITAAEVHRLLGTSARQLAIQFVQFLCRKETQPALQHIASMQEDGIDLKHFTKNVLSYLRNLLLLKTNPQGVELLAQLTADQVTEARILLETVSLSDLLTLTDLFQKSLVSLKDTPIPQLPLELAVIEYQFGKQPNKTTMPLTVPTPTQPAPMPAPVQTTPQPIVAPTPVQPPTPTTNPTKKTPATAPLPAPNNLPQRTITLDEVISHWNQILEGVKPHNHSIHAFLKNCVPCGVLQNTVYIKAKYDFYKDKLNEVQNRLTVRSVIATILNSDLSVTFVTDQECNSIDFGVAPAQNQTKNVLHDAMQIMGGRIVE